MRKNPDFKNISATNPDFKNISATNPKMGTYPEPGEVILNENYELLSVIVRRPSSSFPTDS